MYYNRNNTSLKKTEIGKNIFIKQENKTEQKKQEKNLTKVKKINENNEKLNLIIDLNISEPQKEQKNNLPKKEKNFKDTIPVNIKKESSFTMMAKTLPSYATCITLAEKYYQEGNYKEALKWAKNANIQNNKNPESWILSAKSLYKLGKKEEALKVLKIYYNYRKDEKVKKLMGELNENH
ncbi:CDC27 family protein [Nautilia lithotrophica]